MVVKVLIAFNNMLFSEGVSKLLEEDGQIEVIKILEASKSCREADLEALAPDVVLVDFATLYNSFPEKGSATETCFILFDTNIGRENIATAVLKKRLSGLLKTDDTPEQMIKAIKAVARGEVWIDNTTVKNLLFGVNAVNKSKTAQLSKKENEVVELVSEGFTNKEIAARLYISEPTVKTHLNRIFRKLEIKNRAQLVTYAIKNQDANSTLF